MPFILPDGIDPDNLPEDMPEHVKNLVRKQFEIMKRWEMRSELADADLESLWAELPVNLLRAVRNLLHGIRNSDSPAVTAGFYEGVARQTIALRFHVCGDCGFDHAEIKAAGFDPHTMEVLKEGKQSEADGDVEQWLKSQTPETALQKTVEPTTIWPASMHQRIVRVKTGPGEYEEFPGVPRTKLELDEMELYGLDEEYNPETHEFVRLYCVNCGMTYVSIQDRVLKGPDECSGCFRKAAQG